VEAPDIVRRHFVTRFPEASVEGTSWWYRAQAMIETRIRGRIEPFLDPIGRWLARLGVTPMFLTMSGLALAVTGAVLVARGSTVAGGLVFAAGSTLDGLDGTVARVTGTASRRGALIDSVADRIGEAAMWGAIAFWLSDTPRLVMACIFCLGGAFLTSYLRAKAEAVGADGSGGLVGRGERVVLMTIGLVFGIVEPVLWILVGGIWLTVAQRFWVIWQRIED
jgi:CDP-diacylglycerol--glycerol-3-phosphate 3-phosphatidyltransferase